MSKIEQRSLGNIKTGALVIYYLDYNALNSGRMTDFVLESRNNAFKVLPTVWFKLLVAASGK